MPVLTMIDITGIQNFVFSSNRLKDVGGGSTIIQQATGATDDPSTSGWPITLGYHRDQILLAAGGNLLMRFESLEEAHAFAGKYSRKMLTEAPGLEAAITHLPYEEGQLAEKVACIQKQIQIAKFNRRPGVPLLNLGVAEICHETGLPATEYDEEDHPISRAVVVRRKAGETVSSWEKLLPGDTLGHSGHPVVNLKFPADLDFMGRSRGDTSLAGIVHMDGNGMGMKISEWMAECVRQKMPDEQFAIAYKELGRQIDNAVTETTKRIFARVIKAIVWKQDEDSSQGNYVIQGSQGSFPLYKDHDVLYLPIRLLICAGDELTFACDGRIALDLASFALQEFGKISIPQLGILSGCAGVSIVRTHTPIIKAYYLAEELCANSKKRIREIADEKYRSALDWHIGALGTTESLEDMRRRQYKQGDATLTMRPYFLHDENRPEPGTWHWLNSNILGGKDGDPKDFDGFQGPKWRRHHAKATQLRQLVRQGGKAVEKALQAWRISAPEIKLPGDLPNTGFVVDAVGAERPGTPLLDAIELCDLALSLGGD